MAPQIHIADNLDSLSQAIAEQWIVESEKAISHKGVFHVALSGGSTPRSLHQVLSSSGVAGRINWEAVHIYFGDERSVPADHPQSNYRMARETLLANVPIPEQNVHPIIMSDDIKASAQAYSTVLLQYVPINAQGVPQLDLILLGIGDDGHTASLFPGTSILSENEKFVDAVYVDRLGTWRVSVTYPILNNAHNVFIMATGQNKASIINEVFNDKKAVEKYPVQMIKPKGRLVWFVDKAAAKTLSVSS